MCAIFTCFFFSCQQKNTDTSHVGLPNDDVLENIILPQWSQEDIEQNFNIALEQGLPSIPYIRDVYSSYLQQRTYLCPTMENPSSTTWTGVWQSYCVSDSGYTYEGQALYSEEILIEEHYFYQNMVASFLLISAEDEHFLGGGEFESTWNKESDDTFFWEGRIGGTYRYSAAEGWLLNGESSLFWTAYGHTALDEIYVDGGIGYHAMEPNIYLFFEKFSVKENAMEGQIWIRDPSSYWWVLSFNEDYQNCAVLSFDNLDKGQICVGDEIQYLLKQWFEEMKDYVYNDVFVIVQ